MQFSPGPPLVSVILPSFNHAAFVGEAVQSVLDQTFRDLELIVVDDASSDETADVVASIHDPRLTLIRLSENRAVHARNLALSQARGQYVAFQNSDDIWVPASWLLSSRSWKMRANMSHVLPRRKSLIRTDCLPATLGRTGFLPPLIARLRTGFSTSSMLETACRCLRQ